MKVIIFGVGDFSKQLYYYISKCNEYKIEYFCVNKNYFSTNKFLNKDVIIFEDDLKLLSVHEYKFILGVGYNNLRMRKIIFDKIKQKGFDFINYINPTARIFGDIVGEGNIILPNVTVEPYSKINNNNVIWSNSLICHDSIIGDHNFIAANSIIGGFSKVVESNFLGFNATIKDKIVVDKEVLIGAKSLVMRSPENYSVYYGIPAKKIREHCEKGIKVV
ncbi:MAG: acetyltransferase [Halanaerobiales bacterium]|nr:acetyltransferase [Halanaerobiales bacterium]